MKEYTAKRLKHTAVHGAYGKHLAKTGELDPKYHRWLLESFHERMGGDYGVDDTATQERVDELIAQAREFVPAARQYLGAESE